MTRRGYVVYRAEVGAVVVNGVCGRGWRMWGVRRVEVVMVYGV